MRDVYNTIRDNKFRADLPRQAGTVAISDALRHHSATSAASDLSRLHLLLDTTALGVPIASPAHEGERVISKYRSTVKNLVEAAPRAPRVTMLKRHSVSFYPFEARAACKEAINAQRSSEVDEESDGSRHAHAMAALRRKSEERAPCPAGAASADAETAPALEMDHVHLSFGQYLWGAHFVTIPSILLLLIGSARLLFALALKRVGLLRTPQAQQLESMACDLILESSLSIQVQARRHDQHGDEIGTFVWSPFPMSRCT